MTNKIIVGFRTRPVADELLQAITPEFAPRGNLKDKLKIEADLQEKRERFAAEAADMPYTGTFESVALADPANQRAYNWTWAEGQRPLCLAIADWVLEEYGDAWTADSHESRPPRAVFLGFNVRRFLKMWGEECSLPEHGQPLPPRLWYGASEHRDIVPAVVPEGFPSLTLETALKRRRPPDDAGGKQWDALLAGWGGPHVDPVKDVFLTIELATQLGLL